MARTAIQNEQGPVVGGSRWSPQSLPFCLYVGDEDIAQSSIKNLTSDKEVCCRVDHEFSRDISILEKQRIDGDDCDDDGECVA